MHLILTLLAPDLLLGRINYDSLSVQTRMELLVGNLSEESKAHFQDEHKELFLDVADWWFVKQSLDGVPKVLSFDQGFGDRKTVGGSMDFSFIPPSVTSFALNHYAIEGSLETGKLPENLEYFTLQGNIVKGTVDLRSLPGKIITFNACRNIFTGSCHLDALPETITLLYLSGNELSGSIVLDALPPNLQLLHLNGNKFSGTVCLSKLSQKLEELIICQNALRGEFILVDVPKSLRVVSAERNDFDGCAVAPSPDKVQVYLGNTKIEKIVNEDGEEYKPLQFVFDKFFQSYISYPTSPMYSPGEGYSPGDFIYSPYS